MFEFWPQPIPKLQTRLHLLILQHPQEPDKSLGTAALAHAALSDSTLRVGLSWPNLKKALGDEAEPGRWAVLYLGSGIKKTESAAPSNPIHHGSEICFVNKQGVPLSQSSAFISDLEGLVVLDGTWSQAKALWWRNPWLLKLRRVILTPKEASLYGRLRREPRRGCLSTIESIAVALTALGEPEKVGDELRTLFSGLLDRYAKRPQIPSGEQLKRD